MNKAFSNFTWENEPSENTAVNAENLNKINNAIDIIDSRVVTHETTKLDKTTANTMVKDVAFDNATGIFTITKLNGSVLKIDTKLEKLAVNFNYDKNTQILSIILEDGTTQEVDLSSLITQYEFAESDTIILTVGTDGKVVANIKNGSITGDMLEPNYLANVTIQANNAASSASTAKTQADRAKSEADRAEEAAKEAEAATGLHIDDALSSTSINPVQNKAIKTALDQIQTTSSGTLSEAGWYRVAKYVCSLTDALKGSFGNSCDLFIKRAYNNSYTEVMLLNLDSIYNNQTIKAIRVKSQLQIITKARYTIDTTNSVAYLEIYYDSNINNDCSFEITHPKDKLITWQAITPTLTSEEVDGVTVTATYDIPANASPVTDLDIAEAIEENLHGMTLLTNLPNGITNESTMQELINILPANSILETRADLPLAPENWCNIVVIKTTTHFIMAFAKSQQTKNIYVGGTGTNNLWNGWEKHATTTDLVTELAKYLALDGGVLNKGAVITFTKADDSALSGNVGISHAEGNYFVIWERGGANRGVKLDLTECGANNGSKLLHTENIKNYALAKDGGGTVQANANTFLELKNTGGNVVLPQYSGIDGVLGFLGFSEANTPVYGNKNGSLYNLLHVGNFSNYALAKDGGGTVNGHVLVNSSEKFPLALTNNANTGAYVSFWDEYEMYGALGFNGETFAPEFYDYGMGKHYPLLHTGNSNAVIVASSAPSDTTALWYDTTNKMLKRYVDGAWQQ